MALTKIRYKGLSDERAMSKKELADVGIHVDQAMKWEGKNAWAVHMESPSDEMLDMLKRDGNFIVEEVDAESGATVQNIVKHDPDKADDTGATIVNHNDARAVEADDHVTYQGQTKKK